MNTSSYTCRASAKFNISMLHRAFGIIVCLALAACGGSRNTATQTNDTPISPDSPTVISSDTAILTVPAGTFEAGLTVSLSETADAPPEITTSTPISPVITMTFSDTRATEDQASFSLAITLSPDDVERATNAGDVIYALARESSDALAHVDEEDDSASEETFPWRVIFGELDETNGTYTLTLGATAETMDILVTHGNDFYVYAGLPNLDINTRHVPPISSIVDGGTWDTRPWAVICYKQTLGSDNEHACDPNADPQEAFILDDVLNEISEATALLSLLGWADARTHVMTQADILARNLPSHSHITTAEEATSYNVIFLSGRVPRANADARGGYFYDSRDIYVVPRSLDAGRQHLNGNVYAHELFHAVQGAFLPIPYESRTVLNDYLWFMESTAQVMGMFSLDGNEAALPSKKAGGIRRTWDLSLRNTDYFLTPYRTFEFFAFLNEGDVDYLPDLINHLSENGTGVDAYSDVNNALEAVFDQNLADAYTTRVMSQRGVQSDENDCTYVNITSELEDDGVFTMTPGDGYALNIELTPMSSLCFDVFADREEASLTRITVTSDDTEQRLLALGDEDHVEYENGENTEFTFAETRGVYADAGTRIRTIGDSADIRIIRDAYQSPDSDVRDWRIKFQNDFTGTWCSSHEFDQDRTPCEDYGSLLHLEEDDNGNLTGSGMIFVCEVTYPLLTTNDLSHATGNSLSIALNTSAINTNADCDDFSATFSLTYVDGHLEGTWSLPERGILTPAQTETVILTRVSVDPDYDVPFEVNPL